MDIDETNQNPKTWAAVGLFVFDFIKIFVIAVAIIVPIRWFLFQPFVVTGDSMRPNFQDGDYLIIDEISYRFREPDRGDVIVLRFPNDESQFFIKRIVGLPNDRVVVENGKVEIYNTEHPQGLVLQEPYLPSNNLTYGNLDMTLGQDEFFVLGDNRLSSSDSRIWGTLPREDVVGRVFLRIFPLPRLQAFSPPAYNPAAP
ncbi:MAG: signal peptidase I [Candidatus Doudnabacteria bacterium]|nr:signal peptidase I [bacterium]MDZ4244037.1 signal peptidase I [Candidatus Doudnabacteria bacterium]